MYDLRGNALMTFDQTKFFESSKEGAVAAFELEVAAGMDPLQAICVCISCQQLLEDRDS